MENPDQAAEQLTELLDDPSPRLDEALLLLSEHLQQKQGVSEAGLQALDQLAADLLAADSTAAEVASLVKGLFVDHHYVGDVENYHNEENSFLDRVIEKRTGMPISLAALTVTIARRLGTELHLLGLPGHVVVGIANDPNNFIDAFSGTLLNRNGLEQRLHSIFGREVPIDDEALTPMTTVDVVLRVSNNLMRTWSDQPRKFDRLLDLRSRLPLPRADQLMLIELAEARARFDIAARLREAVDPDDVRIDELWGRLN